VGVVDYESLSLRTFLAPPAPFSVVEVEE